MTALHLHTWGPPDAPPLLLLHGFPEYGGAWAEVAAHLPGYRCIAPDQRGYGQSWSPPEVDSYRLPALVGDMAALVEHIGRGPVIVLGHDWGAAAAYGLAIFRPDLVSRLVIGNGVHPAPFQTALATGGAQCAASQYIRFLRRPDSHEILAADDYGAMLKFFASKMDLSWLAGPREEEYRTEWKRGGGRLATMIHWYRATPLVVGDPGVPLEGLPAFDPDRLMVRCPHLLIWGEKDAALLPEATEGLETYAPDLTRVTLPDADHWLFHQKPDETAAIIADWLAERI